MSSSGRSLGRVCCVGSLSTCAGKTWASRRTHCDAVSHLHGYTLRSVGESRHRLYHNLQIQPNLTQPTCVLRASDKDNREKEPQPEEAQLVQATSYAAHVSNKLKKSPVGRAKHWFLITTCASDKVSSCKVDTVWYSKVLTCADSMLQVSFSEEQLLLLFSEFNLRTSRELMMMERKRTHDIQRRLIQVLGRLPHHMSV